MKAVQKVIEMGRGWGLEASFSFTFEYKNTCAAGLYSPISYPMIPSGYSPNVFFCFF